MNRFAEKTCHEEQHALSKHELKTCTTVAVTAQFSTYDVLFQRIVSRLGIRRPAGHPFPGDVCQERDERGAGVHDHGRGDQEPRGSAGAVGRHRAGQDRVDPGPGQERRRVLLGFIFEATIDDDDNDGQEASERESVWSGRTNLN